MVFCLLLAVFSSYALLGSHASRVGIGDMIASELESPRSKCDLKVGDIVCDSSPNNDFYSPGHRNRKEGIVCMVGNVHEGQCPDAWIVWKDRHMGDTPTKSWAYMLTKSKKVLGANIQYVRKPAHSGQSQTSSANGGQSGAASPHSKPKDSAGEQAEESTPVEGAPSPELLAVAKQVDEFVAAVSHIACGSSLTPAVIPGVTKIRTTYMQLLPRISADHNNCETSVATLPRCQLCNQQLMKLNQGFQAYRERCK